MPQGKTETSLSDFIVPTLDTSLGETSANDVTSIGAQVAPHDFEIPPGTAQPTRAAADSLPTAILENWSKLASIQLTSRFYNRLLRAAVSQRGMPLKTGPLRAFLDFWLVVRSSAVTPEIVIAPDGSLHAEWYKSDRDRLDIRFTDRQAFFGLFANKEIYEGVTNPAYLANILLKHPARPLRWNPR